MKGILKMAEYINTQVQTVAVGANVLFNEEPVSGSVCVRHREGSGVVTLRGITNQCRARFRVSFGANIAVPTGETPGAISVALTYQGEALVGATAIVTPAAVGEYFNVFVSAFVDVDRGCCVPVSVENTSTIPIDVQNANIIIERIA
jgi:hypothetical protein